MYLCKKIYKSLQLSIHKVSALVVLCLIVGYLGHWLLNRILIRLCRYNFAFNPERFFPRFSQERKTANLFHLNQFSVKLMTPLNAPLWFSFHVMNRETDHPSKITAFFLFHPSHENYYFFSIIQEIHDQLGACQRITRENFCNSGAVKTFYGHRKKIKRVRIYTYAACFFLLKVMPAWLSGITLWRR